MPHRPVVGGKDIHALEDGAVLDNGFLTVLNLQQVLESLLEVEHLHIESPSGDILVIVVDIWVFGNGFQILFPSVIFGKHFGERCLATTDISCYCYIHLFILNNLYFKNYAEASLQLTFIVGCKSTKNIWDKQKNPSKCMICLDFYNQ